MYAGRVTEYYTEYAVKGVHTSKLNFLLSKAVQFWKEINFLITLWSLPSQILDKLLTSDSSIVFQT